MKMAEELRKPIRQMGARLTSVSRQYHRETKTMRPDTEQYQYHGIYKYRDTVIIRSVRIYGA